MGVRERGRQAGKQEGKEAGSQEGRKGHQKKPGALYALHLPAPIKLQQLLLFTVK